MRPGARFVQSVRLVAVTILTVVLALSSTLNAYAATELKYDDGVENTYDCPNQGTWRAVKFFFSDFSLSGAWKLLTARIYQSTEENAHDQLELHVLKGDGSGDLAGSTPVTFTTVNGWNDIDLSGQSIIVSGDFWIAYKWLSPSSAPCLALDNSAVDGKSSYGSPSSWTLDLNYDYMIRAVIDPAPAVPEYPLSLPLLAIFMIIAYGLIKSRTGNPRNI
jgi:hypothetical protein